TSGARGKASTTTTWRRSASTVATTYDHKEVTMKTKQMILAAVAAALFSVLPHASAQQSDSAQPAPGAGAGQLGSPVNVVFLSFNGGLWQWGYPYSASVQGVGDIPVMCDDYAHGGSPGEMWLANSTDLGSGNLSLLRFNNLPGALNRYDEAAWLLLETQTTPKSAWRDMNV